MIFKQGRLKRAGLAGIVLALSALLLPSTASPQDVAVGQATATVLAVLAVSATSVLAFGTVYQGVPVSIANNNASAGVFTITGEAGAGISIYMQLPDYLATASGDDRMIVSFSTTDASIDSTANVDPTTFGAGWQNQDPHNLPSTIEIGNASAQAAIFLGGTVNPSVDQTAGAYTGDIVVTVAYNGS
jgi:hypothetical protein